jgi:hypothetical protein
MFSFAILSALLHYISIGPDNIDFVSALTQRHGLEIPNTRSFLDGDEKTRLLKDIKLKIGDVAAKDSVGFITIDTERTLGSLKAGRHYQ